MPERTMTPNPPTAAAPTGDRAPRLLAIAAVLAAIAALGACGRTALSRHDDDAGFDADPDTTPDVVADADADALDAEDVPPDGDDDADAPDVPDTPDLPPGVCGDGVLNAGEECDDAERNSDVEADACRSDCRRSRCGDGVVDSTEQCDDGNTVDNDPCDNRCQPIADPCAPCGSDFECGRDIDRCAVLLDGTFCTIACDARRDCPEGLVCTQVPTAEGQPATQCVPELEVCAGCLDRDGDGYGIGLECLGPDCDDTDPRRNPGAEEICNDVDDDCDRQNDEGCPPDLIVDAETIELSGTLLFDRVEIRNGGRVTVAHPPSEQLYEDCAPDGPGCLQIDARIIRVLADSGIDASGAGRCARGVGTDAGFGPGLENVGPGGGGYGGAGGAGPGLSGGRPYGNASNNSIQMGAPGRGFRIEVPGFEGGACDDLVGMRSEGGAGGGCIRLSAPDIEIAGYLRSSGSAGQSARDSTTPAIVDGGAGGSGGGILVDGFRVTLERGALLSARGGSGGRGATYTPSGGGRDSCIGNGGGGGGGGRVKVFGSIALDDRGAAMDARGGDGATGPQNNATSGERGSVFTR